MPGTSESGDNTPTVTSFDRVVLARRVRDCGPQTRQPTWEQIAERVGKPVRTCWLPAHLGALSLQRQFHELLRKVAEIGEEHGMSDAFVRDVMAVHDRAPQLASERRGGAPRPSTS
ncbi:MAG TPA: hypothetical protein VN213_02405 [Solirubrobacteraceae bacterium]|nr:hypothetical protein [Solirubrobacteraceae bacterium]